MCAHAIHAINVASWKTRFTGFALGTFTLGFCANLFAQSPPPYCNGGTTNTTGRYSYGDNGVVTMTCDFYNPNLSCQTRNCNDYSCGGTFTCRSGSRVACKTPAIAISSQCGVSYVGGACDGSCSSSCTCVKNPLPLFPDGDSYDCDASFGFVSGTQCYDPGSCPIVIDLGDEGFHLTSRAEGVLFDIQASGTLRKTSWTDPAYKNAWLVLDRDGNGKITSGKELFGNFTTQAPASKDKPANGFAALAQFDLALNGGNGDGLITKADKVFPKLRVWIDKNHDGVSQPDELITLDQAGITKIDLGYKEVGRTDEFGNAFRFKGLAVVNGEQRTVYDVFLVTKKVQ